jgi:hypothetical protein
LHFQKYATKQCPSCARKHFPTGTCRHVNTNMFDGRRWRRLPSVPDPRQQIKCDLWETLTLHMENPTDSGEYAIRIMREAHDTPGDEDSERWFNHLGTVEPCPAHLHTPPVQSQGP